MYSFVLALIVKKECLNFRRDITETESWVILRAEHRSKAQVILNDDGSLCVEH